MWTGNAPACSDSCRDKDCSSRYMDCCTGCHTAPKYTALHASLLSSTYRCHLSRTEIEAQQLVHTSYRLLPGSKTIDDTAPQDKNSLPCVPYSLLYIKTLRPLLFLIILPSNDYYRLPGFHSQAQKSMTIPCQLHAGTHRLYTAALQPACESERRAKKGLSSTCVG